MFSSLKSSGTLLGTLPFNQFTKFGVLSFDWNNVEGFQKSEKLENEFMNLEDTISELDQTDHTAEH